MSKRYTPSPLLTDLYQLTMAYGYWKNGMADREAVFHLFFRKSPFGSGYTIAAGLSDAIAWLKQLSFAADDLSFLAGLRGNDDRPLFEDGFIDYLRNFKFSCDIDAVQEGSVVFPHEPLLRVRGPILQGQLVETALLNIINFQTLIATKSARICQATGGDPVLEFGLRRAQGVDGALAASRAAYIGGCAATSNVLAGQIFGIPVKGTHAHSWVMSHDTEEEAFRAYAEAMPNNCVFLIDTYDTIEGVKNAIEEAKRLRKNGHELVGVRLDSGDLAYLSIEARRLLDEAGFPEAVIVASNDLDEEVIYSLRQQGAKIGLWGVGTKLVTAYDQPALGGGYKLGAIKNEAGEWSYRIKLSEQAIKVSNPGILQVRRFQADGKFLGDMIFNENSDELERSEIIDPANSLRRTDLSAGSGKLLLIPIFREGNQVYAEPALSAIRQKVQDELQRLHPGVRRLLNPHEYPVGLAPQLFEMKQELVMRARAVAH
ncbi:MAG: nicotinate phosphoribosyltransferase [Synoicihabitans sp.]